MDWYSWLSKTTLDSSLVYEYSLVFASNELEEDDIVHLNHEVLQSMGVSIAKHRLEILKLAEKKKKKKKKKKKRAAAAAAAMQPVAKILAAVKKTKKCVADYFRPLIPPCDSSAIVVVPKNVGVHHEWRSSLLKRNKRMVFVKERNLLLTNGAHQWSSDESVARDHWEKSMDSEDEEIIRWDSMFEDLKPT